MTPLLLLHLDEVLALHEEQIRLVGGAGGIRDLRVLESAVGTPAATFDGAYLHDIPFEMAAAYLHSISRNHPFVDGNKRTALAAALTFLELNDVRIEADEDELYDLVVGVAEGRVNKSAIAVFLERNATGDP